VHDHMIERGAGACLLPHVCSAESPLPGRSPAPALWHGHSRPEQTPSGGSAAARCAGCHPGRQGLGAARRLRLGHLALSPVCTHLFASVTLCHRTWESKGRGEWFLGEVGQKERPRRGRAGPVVHLRRGWLLDHRIQAPQEHREPVHEMLALLGCTPFPVRSERGPFTRSGVGQWVTGDYTQFRAPIASA
jgi:hypothetical protein